MTNQFEHLQLPKTNIQYTRRSQRGFSGGKRTNRSDHGSKLLSQVYLEDVVEQAFLHLVLRIWLHNYSPSFLMQHRI